MIIPCARCGKEFKTLPCFIKRGTKYCSRKCQSDVPKIFITCKICGTKKRVKPYKKNQPYCSTTCKGKDRELVERISIKATATRRRLSKEGKIPPAWNKGISVRLSPKTEFQKGLIPWNKATRGIMKVNDGSFKKGQKPKNKMPIGMERTRKMHDGSIRYFVKIKEPNIWKARARFIWENVWGDIPKGYIIHHKDTDPQHDEIENLDCLTRAEHINIHRHDVKKI